MRLYANYFEIEDTDQILWNNSPLDQISHNDPNDTLTKDGGVSTQDYYKNLPSFLAKLFPMLGTRDRGSSDENSLYLPEKTRVYLLTTFDWWYGSHNSSEKIKDSGSWSNSNYQGNYFGGYTDVKIYKRILSPGYYTLDNYHAYFLFADPL